MTQLDSITPAAEAPPRARRRSGAGNALLYGLIVLGVSTLGLVLTLVLGLGSLADTGLGFQLGTSGTTGEEYVWDEQGIDALLGTIVWGLSFSVAMLASSGVATVAGIILIVRSARN